MHAIFNESLPHAVSAHGEIGILLDAALGEIAGDRLRACHTDDGAASGLRDHVVRDQRAAGAGRDRDRDADVGLAHDVAGDRDVAQIMPPSQHDARGGRVLDYVAGDRRVGLHRDADAAGIAGVGAGRALRVEVADDVALHDGEPSAFVEIGDRDADRRAVDGVVGDQRAFEAELGVERDLAHVDDAVALDVDVGGGVAAHGGEGAVLDPVAAHDHVAGAKDVDRVAVLPRAAGAVGDVLDAVVGDDGAVVAGGRAPDLDAVVAGAADAVARDHQSAGIERMQGDVGAVGNGRVDHRAVDGDADQAVAPGLPDLAIRNLDAPAVLQLHQAAPFRQRPLAAV